MYNPNSVVQSMLDRDFDSYLSRALSEVSHELSAACWKNTSSFASINTFITMNYAGLKDDVMTMLTGGMVMVDPRSF